VQKVTFIFREIHIKTVGWQSEPLLISGSNMHQIAFIDGPYSGPRVPSCFMSLLLRKVKKRAERGRGSR